MQDIRRVVHTILLVTIVAAVMSNAILFALAFPGNPWELPPQTSVVQAAHLPVQPDAYLVPTPPAFLATITAADISLTSLAPAARVYLRRHADHQQPLASLTKLVTALVVLDQHPDWTKEIIFSREDQRGGVRTPLTPGAAVSLEDLWKLSLVASDNDATMALAHNVGLTDEEFTQAMNNLARNMHVQEVQFVEPTGLSPSNVASARDFAVLARRALTEPRIRDVVALPETVVTISGKRVRVLSSDQLLKFHKPGEDGWTFVSAKTGFVDEAGYNVALLAETKSQGDLLLVALGSSSIEARASEAEKLMAWAVTAQAQN